MVTCHKTHNFYYALSLSMINIQIIGVRGGNYKSDIAIDDIEFKKGACGAPAPTDAPKTTRAPEKVCKPWQKKKCCKNGKNIGKGKCNCRCGKNERK